MEEEAAPIAAGKMYVVLFPWLAFGHLIPFLELAKRLAARGHAVSFLSTPRNIARLPPVPPRLSSLIRLVSLPAPKVDGLPEGAESTADVPPEMNELIKKAVDGLASPFAAFLSNSVAGGRKPDWIINDFCHHWLPSIADGIPCATFFIVQPVTIAFFGPRDARGPSPTWEDFTAPPAWCGGPSSSFPPAVAYRRHEAEWVATVFRPNASGVSDLDRMWAIVERSRLVIFRSCEELDPGAFDLLTDIFQKPVVPAGILFQPEFSDDDDDESEERPEVLRWLDDQPPKSVIYVALGSEAPLTAHNLRELALGLDRAGVRFLWAFRKPAGTCAPDADVDALLPAGFPAASARGLVRTGWVPQARVLAHAAVGAFLTHCGWGSTVECLAFGHPMVMLPFVVDQPLVARTMAMRGVGVEVERDDVDGSFKRDAVAAAVRRVMVEEEGKVFASNAARMKEVLGDQRRQDGCVDALVECLGRYKDSSNCSEQRLC
ncbi:hypothetical protein QOZ80_3AG0211880 [Eleusine coracana subsp. coracana]|nr:hypothetical protein QOZ80_3AG0211880 [Eleusine coracana subsp. coracana]